MYRNDGGSFVDIAAGLTGVRNGSVAWGDYDNDGDLDILLTGNIGFAFISRVICAFYWFHPLVWWVERRAREEAEHACDQLVVEQGIAPARYARHLVDIIRDANGMTREA